MARPSGASPLDVEAARTVILVRHGATSLTDVRAYSGGGVPGPSLTSRGRTQAARAADAVFRIGTTLWPDLPRAGFLVASPLVRTVETAAAVGRRIGQHVRTDERFDECVFGEWEGLTPDLVADRWPHELRAWATTGIDAAPGGESYVQVAARAWDGLTDVVTGAPAASTTVVVAHTVTIRALVGRALDAPPATWPRLRVPPGSLTILRLGLDTDAGVPTLAEVTAAGVPTDT